MHETPSILTGMPLSERSAFALVGYPKAKYAYAWTYREGNQNKTVVVLKIPPVDSPQTAVKVAIAAKARE